MKRFSNIKRSSLFSTENFVSDRSRVYSTNVCRSQSDRLWESERGREREREREKGSCVREWETRSKYVKANSLQHTLSTLGCREMSLEWQTKFQIEERGGGEEEGREGDGLGTLWVGVQVGSGIRCWMKVQSKWVYALEKVSPFLQKKSFNSYFELEMTW